MLSMEERVQLCEEFMNTSERMSSEQSIKRLETVCLVQTTTVCWLASDSLSLCYTICEEVIFCVGCTHHQLAYAKYPVILQVKTYDKQRGIK